VRRELTTATRELTSETCELTSERRDVTSVAWRVHMNRRRVPIGAVEVISERYIVPARREEAPGDQYVAADERRYVPAMRDDVPVARQSVNSARRSAPRHRGDVSDALAYVAREHRVVAMERTDGLTRRWMVTTHSDDVTGRRRELPLNARAGSGERGNGVRAEITVRVVSTYQITASHLPTLGWMRIFARLQPDSDHRLGLQRTRCHRHRSRAWPGPRRRRAVV
jgi:hypothetical protein